MRNRIWVRLLAITAISTALGMPLAAEGDQRGKSRTRVQTNQSRAPQTDQGRGRGTSRLYQDPASAKGYDSGYDLGLADGRDGQRYDPVRHRDYRDADYGYAPSYGSRDGYKTNFRSGFRQGYEDGYREGTRTR
jgi:hypothetical protein